MVTDYRGNRRKREGDAVREKIPPLINATTPLALPPFQ
jgi:hypothetical protein